MNKSGNAREKATVIVNFDGELYFAIPATSASSECDFSVLLKTHLRSVADWLRGVEVILWL